jgi:hypothetical protein
VFVSKQSQILKKLIITFFRRKLRKIAENCDHNIDPWSLVTLAGVRESRPSLNADVHGSAAESQTEEKGLL